MPRQEELFQEAARLPSGFVYQPRFVTEAEERELLGGIATLDLRQAQYKEFTAHRRVASFGAGYDFDANELTPAPAMPPFLLPLREKVARCRGAPVLALELAPRSACVLRDEARWGWQHAIPPARELRYSITFRTRREEER